MIKCWLISNMELRDSGTWYVLVVMQVMMFYDKFGWWTVFYAQVLLKDRFVERPPRITVQPRKLHGSSLG